MHDFLEDLKQRKTFVAKMAALTGGAVALGMGIPVVFAYVGEKMPALAPFLSAEGSELGLNLILFPIGILAITASCVILEALLLGYEKSTAKRILAYEQPSVRTDCFFILLRISGLMVVLSLLFSLGWLYVIADYIKANTNLAIMSGTDSIALHFAAMAVTYSFLNYWIHRFLHSKYLWEIHKVHHSAEDYNVLLPFRNHPVDYVIAIFYGAFITAVLGIKPEAMMLWLAVNAVYQSMVHSNYDWKWRWVEYILITPQAHRIHHSTAPEHFNSNLGILSIWDRMFGTYTPPKGERIDLGVEDRENFNTDRFFAEIMAVFWRWIGWGRRTGRTA